MLPAVNPSRLKLAALAAVMLLAGSACATPPAGTDGDLVNQWPALTEPTIWQPVVETCHNRFAVNQIEAGYSKVACTSSHGYQTVHVGQLSGDAASQSRPPEVGSAAYRSLWNDCDPRLTAFLGGQWRERKLRLRVGVPSPQAWEARARWYACEVAVVKDHNFGVTTIEGSLKGAFDTQPTLLFGCYHVPQQGDAKSMGCDEPHNTEFVGFVNFGDMSWEDMRAERDKEIDGTHLLCRGVVHAFAAAPNVRTGTWAWNPAEEDWKAGDRTMRCFLWLNETSVSKSLKGVGASGWPRK